MSGDKDVLEYLGKAEVVFISTFVLGELLYGFKGGSKEKENKAALDAFLSSRTVKILHATINTAEFFSSIKFQLKSIGKPVPTNDLWIASHCMESGSMLVSFDRHFLDISGLMVWPVLR